MRVSGAVAALLTLLMTLSGAFGQARDKDDLGVNVTFGWQGQIPTERWAPITLSITTDKATLSGMLVAEFDQDSTNAGRYATPFAVTPGVMTQAQVIVSLSEYCSRIRLSLESESGQVLWSQEFGRVSQGVVQAIPTLIGPDTDVVGVLGRTSLVDAVREWPSIMGAVHTDAQRTQTVSRKGSSRYDPAWSGVAAVRVDEATLPTTWMGYDGLAALIVIPDSSRPVSPRAVEAVHRWVKAGGRLVVQADQPGESWRDWMPAELNVSLEAGRRASPPKEFGAALASLAQTMRSVKEGSPAANQPLGIEGEPPSLASSIGVRVIRPAEPALWVVHMRENGGPNAGALVAERQWGFGSILLVGVDPGRATDLVSTIGTGAVWRSVLEPVMSDVLDRHMYSVSNGFGWGQTVFASRTAVNAGLERVAKVPGLGGGVFILIIVCVVLLAAMVGPVDFLMLRWFGALQKSWATAGLWISVAGVLAFLGPRIVRTEATRVNRVSLVDCIASGPAGEMAGVTEIGGPLAFSTGLTGVYAGEAGVAKLTSPDPSSWWRGVSANYQDGRMANGGGGVALVPIVQKAVGGSMGSERASPLVELPLSLWTFRTFADWAIAEPAVFGRVRATSSGWSVMVSGIPAGAKVVDGVLRIGNKWVTTHRQERVRDGDYYAAVSNAPPPGRPGEVRASDIAVEGGVWSGPFSKANADVLVPRSWAGAAETQQVYSRVDSEDGRPGALTSLFGVARRNRAIDRMLATGRWAAVYLEVSGWPVETPLSWAFKSEHTRILRVLVPVEAR